MTSKNDNPTEKKASVKTKAKKDPNINDPSVNNSSTQAIIELKEGFLSLQKQNDERMSAQEHKLATLYKGLDSTFNKIQQDTSKRETHSSSTVDDLSSTIIRSSEEMRKEYEEMERLQEKRMQAENQQYTHSIKRTKIIAIPAFILGFISIVYMFYTVHVMEKAMTQISQDMTHMRKDMSTLTTNVSSMNANIGGMRQDMNILTHNVAPAMSGMRRMMPWSP